MKLVTMKEILLDAQKNHYAAGAFEFWSYDSARAVVSAAQKVGKPVILQGGEWEIQYAGGYDNFHRIASAVAADFDVPVALHFDHGDSFSQMRNAIDSGFTSVMMDASHDPYDVNVEKTLRVVEMAKPFGVTVEGELGMLEGSEGQILSEVEAQTKPEEALDFVTKTGIDALAVSIGTVHGFYKFAPKINIPRLKEIASVVSLPLVLHGGSGTPDEKVAEAIDNGICKVNICTEFIAAFGNAYAAVQKEEGFKFNVPNMYMKTFEAAQQLALSKITLFARNK